MLGWLFAKPKAEADFEAIFNEHYQYVMRLAFNLTGSRSEAEDILQEVFIAVLKGLPNFRGEASHATWIYRITVRIAGRHRQKRSPYVALDKHHMDSLVARGEMDVTTRQLLTALHKLPMAQRTLLVLVAMEGMSHQQAAEVLGVPVGTIGSRLHTARKALGTYLS